MEFELTELSNYYKADKPLVCELDVSPYLCEFWPYQELTQYNVDYGVAKCAPGYFGFATSGGKERGKAHVDVSGRASIAQRIAPHVFDSRARCLPRPHTAQYAALLAPYHDEIGTRWSISIKSPKTRQAPTLRRQSSRREYAKPQAARTKAPTSVHHRQAQRTTAPKRTSPRVRNQIVHHRAAARPRRQATPPYRDRRAD